MGDHRWNGWPGAVCMNCGIDDPRELCLAESHKDWPRCKQPECQETECPIDFHWSDA